MKTDTGLVLVRTALVFAMVLCAHAVAGQTATQSSTAPSPASAQPSNFIDINKKQLMKNAKETIMKLRTSFCAVLVCHLALVAGEGRSQSVLTASASDIPHLRKQGTATQLIVDGKPYLALAGELSNSSATSLDYMDRIWPMLVAQTKLNTVLPGVSWNQIEPMEGKFDFSIL